MTTTPTSRGLDLHDERARLEVETAITQLDDVVAARLVPGDTRVVDELHAVVSPSRDPKNTARDLQTLLLAGFGIDVDRRVVSVVRLGDAEANTLDSAMPRLTLDAVNLTVRSSETSVSIELLTQDGGLLIGSAGPVGDHAVVNAVAEATVDAVCEAYGQTVLLRAARILRVGNDDVALVTVEESHARASEVLSGSAVVRRAEPDAIARAVLDATNRIRKE